MHVIRRTLLYTVGLFDLQSLELSITIKTFALKFIINHSVKSLGLWPRLLRCGTVLSIRWKTSPVVAEASISQPRSSQGLNSRTRRSRCRLEEFRKKKRSLYAPESVNGRPDRRLQDPAQSKPPQLQDRSRPGHALAEKLTADFRLLDPKEQPSDSSKPNGHASKEATRDEKDSHSDAMTRFNTCTRRNPISDGPTTRIEKITSSATPPGSSLTLIGVQSRPESLFNDDDVKISQAIREGLQRSLSETSNKHFTVIRQPVHHGKKPPKPWR